MVKPKPFSISMIINEAHRMQLPFIDDKWQSRCQKYMELTVVQNGAK